MYTQQVKIIRDFVDNKNKNLNIFWNLPDISETQNISIGPFNYSNTVKNVTHSSTIDHYIGNNRLYSAIIEANLINSVNNLCNHLPMYCKFNINMLNLTVEQEARRHKPNWNKANPDDRNNYRETLSDILSEINPPKQCNQCYTLNW